MTELSIRGLFGPVAMAIALASGYLAIRTNDPLFVWGCLGFTFAGLFFAKDARQLLTGVFKDSDA